MRRPLWLVLAVVAVAAAGAALYVFLSPDRYVATAEVTVTPVTADNLYRGLPVLRSTGRDDDRPVRTVARLVESDVVADRVVRRLRLDTREDALGAIDVEVDEDANLVAIDAEASRADRAAQIANAFADEVVSQRHLEFQSAVVTELERARGQLAQIPAGRRNDPEVVPLSRRVTELRTLEGTGDPTITLASAAVAPEEPERPPVWWIPAAAGAALLLGLLALSATRAPRPAPARDPASAPEHDRRLAERLERALARLERYEAPAPPAAAADTRLDEREAVLERRVQAATERERELDARARGLEERAQALDSGAAELDARSTDLDRRADELARAVPTNAPRRAAGGAGAFNIGELERAVEASAAAQPDKVEEWNGYLFHLRQYAAADGSLPASFDALVDETFGELLER